VQTSNYVGRFGEDVVSRLLHRRVGGRIRFAARHLGDKAQLLDFIVNLVDEFGKEHGPFFFLQVRTTETVARQRQGIRAKFSSVEVKFVQARKVPVYLAAVVSKGDDCEDVYILGIDGLHEGGVRVVPRLFPLSDESVRLTVYEEVHDYFASGLKVFVSRLTKGRKT
jgi:hypothetical protein